DGGSPVRRTQAPPDRSAKKALDLDLGARARRRVLVLGGARSGKSFFAERIFADSGEVEYVATGPGPGGDDPEWAARADEHRRRWSPDWRTTETLDLEQVLKSDDRAPVLVDCLSVWLARVMDECEAWTAGADGAREVAARTDRLVRAWRSTARHVVA